MNTPAEGEEPGQRALDEAVESAPTQPLLNVALAFARRQFGARCKIDDFGADETLVLRREDLIELALTLNLVGEELQATHGELQETSAMLIQAAKLTALGEMAAGVAHELNQPLNGIALITQETLRDFERGPLDADTVVRDSRAVLGLVKKMAHIIEHMKRFARRPDVRIMAPVNVNGAVTSALDLFREQMRAHHIDLEECLTPDLPEALGDAVSLEQVMVNLLSNAHDAVIMRMKANGRDAGRILVRTSRSDDELFIVVQDDGTGVPLAIRDRIFEAFFTTKPQAEGTGLGLAIAHRLVTEFGGRLELIDAAATGAAFQVALPLLEPSHPAGPPCSGTRTLPGTD